MNYKQEIEIKGSRKYNGEAIGLLGPPGVGKSTIGKLLAEKLNIQFYDLDDLIAKSAGVKTIKGIINTQGWPEFKRIQHQCKKDFFENTESKYILAYGGAVNRPGCNAKLTDENKNLVKKYLFNICLTPSDEAKEANDILWSRQNDGKRETGCKTKKEHYTYVEGLIPQYIKVADLVVFTHAATIVDTVEGIMKVVGEKASNDFAE